MMGGHPGGDSQEQAQMLERYYAAQVIWDEAMAELSADWLSQRAPVRKLVVFAGKAHCAYSAIPARAERRGDFVAVSVLPVSGGEPMKAIEAPPLEKDEQNSHESEHPSSIEELLAADYDFQLIFQDDAEADGNDG